jgi:hypothetical protein
MSENSKDSLQTSESSPQETNGRVGCAHAELDVKKEDVSEETQKTPSPLRGTPPLQGESLDNPKLEASATLKTQGVRPPRTGGAEALKDAAKKAAHSNSRSDIHEYMRIRRNFI